MAFRNPTLIFRIIMTPPPKCQISWELDCDAFRSQIEHIKHVRWDGQASNVPPGSSLADDAMDCAWDDNGKESDTKDVSSWKDPRRLLRSEVVDESSSRYFGTDSFRDDGIEADARFLGLIDEHQSSQHQEQQPDRSESSHNALAPARTASTQQSCDQIPSHPQTVRDRKDDTYSEVIYIPMLPATPTSLLHGSEGDGFETNGSPLHVNEYNSISDETSQETIDIPSIDGVADADINSPEMQQYLFDLHRQRELASTDLDECGHSSMARHRRWSTTANSLDSCEDIPNSDQHKQASVSGKASSSREVVVMDQCSLSGQMPSLVTESTAKSTTSSTSSDELQSSNSSLSLRGGDPNNGLSSDIGPTLAALTSPGKSLQGVNSQFSMSIAAFSSTIQFSTDESLCRSFPSNAQRSSKNTPISWNKGSMVDPAAFAISETSRQTLPCQTTVIKQSSPLSDSSYSESQPFLVSMKSRYPKKRKRTHSGPDSNYQSCALRFLPSSVSVTTPPAWQGLTITHGAESHRLPNLFTSHDPSTTLGATHLSSQSTISTTTLPHCASTPSLHSQKESDETVIQRLEEMSGVIVADQQAKVEMARQGDQPAHSRDIDDSGGSRQQEQQDPQDPREESMDEKGSLLANADERSRRSSIEEAEDHFTASRESSPSSCDIDNCKNSVGRCNHDEGFCEAAW